MDSKENFVLLRCSGCTVWPCALVCKEDALAFFSGRLLVDRVKCEACPDCGGGRIPRCAVDCQRAKSRTALEELGSGLFDIGEKRKNALAALYKEYV